MAHEIRCYEYVNHPYEDVREALTIDAVGIFNRATTHAADRAGALVSQLKVSIAGLEIGKNVRIRIKRVDRDAEVPAHLAPKATRLELEWEADSSSGFFPSMRAELIVYPLSAGETQLDLHGTYEPPGGLLGDAADRLIGHRVAQATVHRMLREIAAGLAGELDHVRAK